MVSLTPTPCLVTAAGDGRELTANTIHRFDPTDMFRQMRPSDETMTTERMQCPMGYTAGGKANGSVRVGH